MPPADGVRTKPSWCRARAAGSQPGHHACQLRDRLRRLRTLQDYPLFVAGHERLALWRQHGAGSLQHHRRRKSHHGRRNQFLLCRLQLQREEGSLQRQVALLLRDIPAADRRLRNQFVFQKHGWNLRQLVPSISRIVVAKRHSVHSDPNHAIPNGEHHAVRFRSFRIPRAFTVYVRIPEWAGAKSSLSVNGNRTDSKLVPGRFLALQRTWKDGDRVEVEFEMHDATRSDRRAVSQPGCADAWPHRPVRSGGYSFADYAQPTAGGD